MTVYFHSEEAEIKTQIIHKTFPVKKECAWRDHDPRRNLEYGNTLKRTDEQSKRLDNSSKVQSENTVNSNGEPPKQTRKSSTSGGATSDSSRNSTPSTIKAFRVKLNAEIVSPTPVATVEVNFHTKMAWNLVQLEESHAITVRK